MSINIQQTCGKARAGVWTLTNLNSCSDIKSNGATQNLKNDTITTPTCLMHTQKGAPPHLTIENIKDECSTLLGISGEDKNTIGDSVSLPPAQIFYTSCGESILRTKMLQENKLKLSKYLNLADSNLVMSIDDPLQPILEDNSFQSGITVDVGTGRSKMTVAEYYRSLCTDMCDIAVAEAPYDRLTPYSTSGRQDKSLKRTQEHLKTYANLLKTENKGQITHFAPVVGGDSIRRRTQSSVFAVEHDDVFAGYSVRSIPKSGPTGHLLELLNASLSSLPSNKVRMLCGWGSPETVLQAVACGVDVFDGTYPYLITEEGCAMMFHFQGMVPHPAEGTDRTRPLSLYDSVFSNDHTPLLPGCKCFACQHHTRSYLHHLLLTHEMLAQVLLMMHNMHHYWVFFESIRASITDGTFEQAAADFHGC